MQDDVSRLVGIEGMAVTGVADHGWWIELEVELAQAQDLLQALAYLLAVLAFTITMASPDSDVDGLLSVTSLLFGAGAYVIRFVSRRG
jgi:hypothetical protein